MASTIKVDNVQNQPGTNVVSKCGTDITLGASGDTVALACGASQTGFGRTGAVNWDTASIKTATFTAVSGNGYFCNTTGGIFNITMPASPSAADIVGLKDYAGTFATNNLTIDRNGSKLDGEETNRAVSADYRSLTLVYVDGTQGWIPIEDGTGFVGQVPAYVVATGGSPCTGQICGDYKIHSFTGPGTLTVSCAGNPGGSNTVDYMVVAGGASGGAGFTASGNAAGGGGAGGFRESVPSPAAWTGSPLANPGGALPVAATPYAIAVGGGGPAQTAPSSSPSAPGNGSDSSFSTITSTGGGAGGNRGSPDNAAQSGGSGGGATGNFACGTPGAGGTGNSPPTPIAQGFTAANNGASPINAAGGGGGATASGAGGAGNTSGAGGAGATTCISASPTAYSGGGGGGGSSNGSGAPGAPGGTGGGGKGADEDTSNAVAGGCNTGGGGGGGGGSDPGTPAAAGGSGIVIIRYKFQ